MGSKAQKMLGISDGANYRKMLEPFESTEKANDAMASFFNDLYELRNKHKIPDVHVVVQIGYVIEDDESSAFAAMHIGDEINAEKMTAYAFSQAQVRR